MPDKKKLDEERAKVLSSFFLLYHGALTTKEN
jgi:hypothetical protein